MLGGTLDLGLPGLDPGCPSFSGFCPIFWWVITKNTRMSRVQVETKHDSKHLSLCSWAACPVAAQLRSSSKKAAILAQFCWSFSLTTCSTRPEADDMEICQNQGPQYGAQIEGAFLQEHPQTGPPVYGTARNEITHGKSLLTLASVARPGKLQVAAGFWSVPKLSSSSLPSTTRCHSSQPPKAVARDPNRTSRSQLL